MRGGGGERERERERENLKNDHISRMATVEGNRGSHDTTSPTHQEG